MNKFIGLVLLLTISFLKAQSTGIIFGNVKDDAGLPVEVAEVFIDGTMYSAFTDSEGNYELEVEPGTYILIITGIGYDEFSQEITINTDEKFEVSTQLITNSTTQLGEAVVVGELSRETETSALNIQRKSVEIKEVKSSQELSRIGVSDAQSAFSKISGVSTMEGAQNVIVRGLGDRYNFTSLNDLPLPSNDPEYKNISLDLFSTDIIRSIDVSKTFLSKQNGDVSGAALNISTKEFTGKPYMEISTSAGVNTGAISEDFLLPANTNWLGIAENVKPYVNNLSQWQFKTGTNPSDRELPINSSLRLSGGKRFNLSETTKLAWFAVASYDSDYSFNEGFERTVNNQGGYFTDFDSKRYAYTSNKLAMSNLVLSLRGRNKIKLNNAIIQNNTQQYLDYYGFKQNVSEETGTAAYIIRQQENQNLLFINQLLAELKFGAYNLDLGASYNIVKADEPDRKTNTFRFVEAENTFYTAGGAQSYNHRYFHNLKENDLAAKAIVDRSFFEDKLKITAGYNYRFTERNFEAIQYNFDFPHPIAISVENLNWIFNQISIDNGVFVVKTYRGTGANALDPQTYDGERTVHSGFLNLDWTIGNLLLTIGGRIDNVNQDIEYNTSLANSELPINRGVGDIKETFILPSLNLKYNLTDDNILRFAASKTYTLPQFKETAPFTYETVTESSFGNPDLEVSDIYNADIKWEYYFSRGELFSLTGFGKYIENPINKVAVPSASDQLSYINAENAVIAGAEVEFKKLIFSRLDETRDTEFSFGINASYLYSNQKNGTAAQFTNEESAIEGASPFIINSDLSLNIKDNLTKGKETTVSIVFNYAHDKIYALGVQNNEDVMEKGMPTLDLIFGHKFNENVGINISARNLLNPKYQRTKEVFPTAGNAQDLTLREYKRGVELGIGLSYKF